MRQSVHPRTGCSAISGSDRPPDLEAFYRDKIGGPADAILKKLIIEISGGGGTRRIAEWQSSPSNPTRDEEC